MVLRTMIGLLRTAVGRALAGKPRPLAEVGSVAPDFELPDERGGHVRLSELRGHRVVLWFYPKADTPG